MRTAVLVRVLGYGLSVGTVSFGLSVSRPGRQATLVSQPVSQSVSYCSPQHPPPPQHHPPTPHRTLTWFRQNSGPADHRPDSSGGSAAVLPVIARVLRPVAETWEVQVAALRLQTHVGVRVQGLPVEEPARASGLGFRPAV